MKKQLNNHANSKSPHGNNSRANNTTAQDNHINRTPVNMKNHNIRNRS